MLLRAERDQLEKTVAELQQQVAQATKDRKLMLAENTTLRAVIPTMPPYDTLELIVQDLRAGQAPPEILAQQQQLPPGEGPEETQQEGGQEEPPGQPEPQETLDGGGPQA